MPDDLNAGSQSNTAADASETVTAPVIESTSLVGGAAEEVITTEGEQNPDAKIVDGKEVVKEEQKEIVYEDFKLPEGVKLDEKFSTEFKTVAKELGLDQTQAQKLVDLQTNFTKDYSTNIDNQFKAQVAEWESESITMLGADYKAKLGVVAKAMNNHGTPEFRKLLNETGLGNHKEVVNFFYNIGTKMSESKMRDGGSASNQPSNKTLSEKHYPNTKLH